MPEGTICHKRYAYMSMDWVNEAKRVFSADKPAHFTNYLHCEECLEHDETLLDSDIDKIGLEELGKPGWDPVCFCTAEGIKYYMPSFVRLSIATMNDDFYLEQFLFHLESNGKDNDLYQSCSEEQRQFILNYIEYIIINHAGELEYNYCENAALKVLEIWSNA